MTDQNKDNISDLSQVRLYIGFIAAVIGVIILQELKNIFIPLFISLLLYFLFNGVVKKMVDLRIPKTLVLIFLLIFIFIMFYLLGVLIYSGISSFIEKFPTYSEKLVQNIQNLFDQLKIPLADVNKYLEKIDWTKNINTSAITTIVSTTFGSFATFIGNLILVLIFLMFMLAGRKTITDRLEKAFEKKRAEKLAYVINAIEDQVQHYLLIKMMISFVTGLLCGTILFFAGMDFVVFSALLIFVLNFIPNFGSIVATLFPVIMGLLKFGLTLKVVLVTLGLMITQFVIGNIIEPKICGKSLNLSPIIILVSLIFWGYIWGIVGMMLAIPLTSAVKIVFQNIPTLKPIAELISSD